MSHRSYLMCLGMMVRVQITRNDILTRDLSSEEYEPGTGDCEVIVGVLNDPYSGDVIEFEKSEGSSQIDIDHIVSVPAAPTLTEDAGHGVTDMPITVQLAKVALAVR